MALICNHCNTTAKWVRARSGKSFPTCPNSRSHPTYAASFRNTATETDNRNYTQLDGSEEQEAFWDVLVNTDKNIILDARAGTGKTFSCMQGILRLRSNDVGFVAFNKSIATELQSKIPYGKAGTFHSMIGLASLRKAFPDIQVNNFKLINIVNAMFEGNTEEGIDVIKTILRKLVGIAKNNLLDSNDFVGITEHAMRFGIEIDDFTAAALGYVPGVLQKCLSNTDEVDFDDMLWMAVMHPRVEVVRFGVLGVDEAQDLNPCQHELTLRAADRIVLVGDPFQSIYGFRGADTASMDNMEVKLGNSAEGVVRLPLTYTRRCPMFVVQTANMLVPEFYAFPGTKEGIVEVIDDQTWQASIDPEYARQNMVDGMELQGGDVILSRTNATLVKLAFRFLKAKQRIFYADKQFAESLTRLVSRLSTIKEEGNYRGVKDLNEFLSQLEIYRVEQTVKLSQRMNSAYALEVLEDRCEVIRLFVDEVREDVGLQYASTRHVVSKINHMLTQDEDISLRGSVINLYTAHRSKGLEADRIFIVDTDKFPTKWAKTPYEIQQERNLLYVAVTRSKSELYFVGGKPQWLQSTNKLDSVEAASVASYKG